MLEALEELLEYTEQHLPETWAMPGKPEEYNRAYRAIKKAKGEDHE
jgi:hypothetical protein